MADLAQWAKDSPGLVLPENPFLAQSGGGSVSETAQPVGDPAPIGQGGDNTVTFILIAVVVVVIGLIVANLMRKKAPGGDLDAPRRPTRDPADRPSKDVLDHRRTVDKVSEIGEGDSLSVVKQKKMEKVKVASYEDAKRELQKRKAGQVKEEARRTRKRKKVERDAAEAAAGADAEPDEDDLDEDAVGADAPETAEDEAEADAGASADAAAEPAAEPVAEAESPAVEPTGPADATEAEPGSAEAETLAAAEPAAAEPAAEAAPEDGAAVIDPSSLFGESADDAWAMDFSGFSLGESPAAEVPAEPDLARSAPEPMAQPAATASIAAEPPKAEAKAPKSDVKPAKAEPTAPKSEVKPAKSEVKPAKVEAKAPKSEVKPAKAEAKAPKSGVKPARTSLKPGKIEPKAPRAGEPTPKSLQEGLRKTRGGFVDRLGNLFKKRSALDEDLIDELEEVLYTADIGPRTAQLLIESVRVRLDAGEGSADPAEAWAHIRKITEEVLTENDRDFDLDSHSPFVLLVVGVNGVGKTTTIGKLATRFTDEGRKVLMVAGDTFRAAATEQLEEWGERTGLSVHVGEDGADPASVVYDGIQRGVEEGYDVVICDTAGRLTNKKNLMKELEKIGRVSSKALDGAPHETLLVLDANTGLMAIEQARMFQTVVDITGIVLTKLDGTAKGGVIIGICKELGVPVRFIGIGEGIYDLRQFDSHEFVEALFM